MPPKKLDKEENEQYAADYREALALVEPKDEDYSSSLAEWPEQNQNFIVLQAIVCLKALRDYHEDQN